MSKRPNRLHLELDRELAAAPRQTARPDVNLHTDDRTRGPDPHRERKRVRRELSRMEGWTYDERTDWLADEVDVA